MKLLCPYHCFAFIVGAAEAVSGHHSIPMHMDMPQLMKAYKASGFGQSLRLLVNHLAIGRFFANQLHPRQIWAVCFDKIRCPTTREEGNHVDMSFSAKAKELRTSKDRQACRLSMLIDVDNLAQTSTFAALTPRESSAIFQATIEKTSRGRWRVMRVYIPVHTHVVSATARFTAFQPLSFCREHLDLRARHSLVNHGLCGDLLEVIRLPYSKWAHHRRPACMAVQLKCKSLSPILFGYLRCCVAITLCCRTLYPFPP